MIKIKSETVNKRNDSLIKINDPLTAKLSKSEYYDNVKGSEFLINTREKYKMKYKKKYKSKKERTDILKMFK